MNGSGKDERLCLQSLGTQDPIADSLEILW